MSKSEDPFEVGAIYRVREGFEAMRDRFAAGEELVFAYSAYSHYDGVRGFFFRQLPGGAFRSWDTSGSGEQWREHFERIGDPDPLLAAAGGGDREGLRARIEALRGLPGESLWIELASGRAIDAGHHELLGELLATRTLDERTRWRLLDRAAVGESAAVVAVLLDAGLSPESADTSRQTPLHHAAARGGLEVVELLLERGADPLSTAGSGGTTPLKLARAWRRSEAIIAALEAAAGDPR